MSFLSVTTFLVPETVRVYVLGSPEKHVKIYLFLIFDFIEHYSITSTEKLNYPSYEMGSECLNEK